MSIDPQNLKGRCPACKDWARWRDNPYRPFCSEACKKHDLGSWASERYRIPVEGDLLGSDEFVEPKKDEE